MGVISKILDETDHCAFCIATRGISRGPSLLILVDNVQINSVVAELDHLIEVGCCNSPPLTGPVGNLVVARPVRVEGSDGSRRNGLQVIAIILSLADAEIAEQQPVSRAAAHLLNLGGGKELTCVTVQVYHLDIERGG